MGIPLRVLIVEDADDDAALLLREFRRGGYDPLYRRVDTREDMVTALQTQTWDIIVSDYAMPQFDGMAALAVLQESGLDLPFIIVSGTIGEETAVAAMKAGAHDYLMKDNLARLIPAVERELKEAEIRGAHERAKQTIRHLSYHDPLTGLLNRREFERRVASTLESVSLQRQQHALCYFDLDQFKVINDTCGHVAGDELLKQLALYLRSHFNDRMNIARLGGDEFGILIKHCGLGEAEQFARQLQRVINDFEFLWQGETFHVSASIGVAIIDAETDNLARLLSAADVACYTAKDLGRNRIHIYQKDDEALNQRHGEMHMVSRIIKALREDRFVLYRQSIVPVRHAATEAHCEILLRMVDEQGGVLSPDTFLPAAERYNLMPTIDRWVIEKVFATKNQSLHPYLERNGNFCSINLSGATLSDAALLDFIRGKTREYGVSPRTICFEITETAAIANLPVATRFIRELKKLGYRFALDDFGSGLSSFAYLKNLPVDFLKIDGSFVKDICRDPTDVAMVEAINHIGHVMGIKTIAEFVESAEVLDKLAEIGVDHAQGYGIDHPRAVPGACRKEEEPAPPDGAAGDDVDAGQD